MRIIQPRKSPSRRAFPGLAGSFLSQPDQEPLPPAPAPKLTALVLTPEDRKAKDAKRKREARKRQREQIEQTKIAVRRDFGRTPPEIIPVVHEKSDPSTSVRATTFSPGKIEQIVAAIGRTDTLRSDDSVSTEYYPVNDRRKVKPEGASPKQEGERQRFSVKQPRPLALGQAMIGLLREYFVQIANDQVCRLCHEIVIDREHHLESRHGDPSEPQHDLRFGDVVGRWVRALRAVRVRNRRTT